MPYPEGVYKNRSVPMRALARDVKNGVTERVSTGGGGTTADGTDGVTIERTPMKVLRVKEGGIDTPQLKDGGVTPEKLADGTGTDTEILWWNGAAWDLLDVVDAGSFHAVDFEETAGVSLVGLAASAWKTLDMPTETLNSEPGSVTHTGGIFKYLPPITSKRFYTITLQLTLTQPAAGWVASAVGVGYRIITNGFPGPWVELDSRWFFAVMPTMTITGSRVIGLSGNGNGEEMPQQFLQIGYRQGGGAQVFPTWTGYVSIKQHGLL